MQCNDKKVGNDTSYWNERAGMAYIYKKEKFYTITPIPYYYARRKIIISKIKKIISRNGFRNICDFACGDGEYIKKIQKKGLIFHGVDLSASMIEAARQNLYDADVDFEISGDGIKKQDIFDMIYTVAVWAHIEDMQCHALLKNIYEHLKDGGMFVMCEQIAPFRYSGGGICQTDI